MPAGSSQLTPLPWSTINEFEVQFSGPVTGITAGSIKLVGGTGGAGHAAAAPTVTSVTSLGGNAYQISLSGYLGYNDYILAIASTGSSFGPAVVNTNGVGISGAFTTGSSSFPSGNGLAGSTFDFAFDVLPGDGNQSGTVNAQDSAKEVTLANVKTTGATEAKYIPFYDFNASGTINVKDNAVTVTNVNFKSSNITAPMARFRRAGGEHGGDGYDGAWRWACKRAGQTGSSSSLTAGSSQASNVSSTSLTAGSSTSAATTSAQAHNTGSVSTGSLAISTTNHRDHSHHRFAATDEAVSDFDLADLFALSAERSVRS